MISIEELQRITDAPLHSWLGTLAVSVIVLLVVTVVHRLGARIVKRIAQPYPLMSAILRYIDRPSLVVLALLALEFLWVQPTTAWRSCAACARRRRSAPSFRSRGCWCGWRPASATPSSRRIRSTRPTTSTRRIHTQAKVLVRTVMVLIVIIGTGAALMTFPNVRRVGASLLASAGVAGLVAGIAARPVLGNLIAGLQIALTQPIRLDDVVVIQGEWGRIEEITGSFVSVRLWDQRRLVVPLQWIIENPFTNWTRSSSEIIGTVYLSVDYRTPLAPLREELARLVHAAPEWDGRVQVLQVTDATERTMQLRALVSAADSSSCWDLRCRVREGLIAYLQDRYPQCLPRSRMELYPHDAAPDAPNPERPHARSPAASTAANTAADPQTAEGR